MKKKIVFMGSKPIGYQCLKKLLETVPNLNAEVVGVLTTKNKLDAGEETIYKLCQQQEIPIYPSLKDYLEIPQVDIVISVQYHKILKQVHIDKAQEIAINLHMAPLPEYRGCNQFSFAIVDDAKVFGTTLHKMETAIDGGDILFESRFPIPADCRVKQLYDLTVQASVQLFEDNLANLIQANYQRTTQQSLEAERGSSYHFRHEINDIKQIDLSWPADKIDRHIRATHFPPFEPPYAMVNGKKVYLSFDF